MELLSKQWKRIVALAASITLILVAELFPRPAQDSPLRIALGRWPGSESLLLARERGLLHESRFTFLEATWSATVFRAFASGAVDAAVLSEEDVVKLRKIGKDVAVICYIDESEGADAIVGSPTANSIAGLKGKRVGVDTDGPGTFLLEHFLSASGMSVSDVVARPFLGADLPEALAEREVEAVVASEPWLYRLTRQGAPVLASTLDSGKPVYRVIAVNEKVIGPRREELVDLIRAHFAMQATVIDPADEKAVHSVLRRQECRFEDFIAMVKTLRPIDPSENRGLLARFPGGNESILEEAMP